METDGAEMKWLFHSWVVVLTLVLLYMGGSMLLGFDELGMPLLAVGLLIWGLCQALYFWSPRGRVGRAVSELALTVSVLANAVTVLACGWAGFYSFVSGYLGTAIGLFFWALLQVLTICGMLGKRLEQQFQSGEGVKGV